MPNLINNPGNLTDVAANYRKSFSPFTLFGTRQLKFYNIYIYNLNLNHPDNGGDYFYANAYESEFGGPNGWDGPQYQPNYGVDSAFARAVAGIQTQAEIYGVWHPDNNSNSSDSDSYFTVMVAGDTHADREDLSGDNQYSANSELLGDAVYNALQGTSCSGVDAYQAYIAGDYMDRDSNNSFSRATRVSLSPEQQSARDALKAARAAVRPTK